jgi:hypothetical protein
MTKSLQDIQNPQSAKNTEHRAQDGISFLWSGKDTQISTEWTVPPPLRRSEKNHSEANFSLSLTLFPDRSNHIIPLLRYFLDNLRLFHSFSNLVTSLAHLRMKLRYEMSHFSSKVINVLYYDILLISGWLYLFLPILSIVIVRVALFLILFSWPIKVSLPSRWINPKSPQSFGKYPMSFVPEWLWLMV